MDKAKAIEIKMALLQLGVKQIDLARAMNVSKASISEVIHGKRTSSRIMTYIEKIIKAGGPHA